MRWIVLAALLSGCVQSQSGEDPSSWYDTGSDINVTESLQFTDQNYAFPANDADGIGHLKDHLFPVPAGSPGSDQVAWGAQDDVDGTPFCQRTVSPDLPFDVDGVVTIFPRYYFKTSGCNWDSAEKYYGSFFIQDRTGGVFMLGDTKVAHFYAGDHVHLRIRAAKTSFGLNMVYAWDDAEIVERGVPIYYQVPTESFGAMAASGDNPIGRVWRVTGTVVNEADTFGAFQVETDDGTRYDVSLDVELTRRGVRYAPGTRLTVTAPMLYSFSIYSMIVMQKGQVAVED